MGTRSSSLFSSSGGIHFKDPWLFMPYMGVSTSFRALDASDTDNSFATTAAFTEMARRGLQDTTNWTGNTYKTLLSVSSGKGLVAAIIGCTAGGAETTTFEITVDGVLTEIAVGTLASGERAALLAHGAPVAADYTTSAIFLRPTAETLEADKATFGALPTESPIPPWRWMTGVPCLRFNTSLLIRAKHSVDITNSTATAYSAVMYRLGL